jgi:hypothetical protein
MRAARIPSLVCAILTLSFVASRVHAESLEYTVKAGCLYKFVQFVNWPEVAFPDKASPIVIGVLGDDPFKDTLERIVRDREVDGRKVVVRHYKDAAQAREAHVLFVNLKGEQLTSAMKGLEGAPTLTVGETASFIEAGGVVRFATRDDKVSFDISANAGKKAGLKIGSQLLRVARVVDGKE